MDELRRPIARDTSDQVDLSEYFQDREPRYSIETSQPWHINVTKVVTVMLTFIAAYFLNDLTEDFTGSNDTFWYYLLSFGYSYTFVSLYSNASISLIDTLHSRLPHIAGQELQPRRSTSRRICRTVSSVALSTIIQSGVAYVSSVNSNEKWGPTICALGATVPLTAWSILSCLRRKKGTVISDNVKEVRKFREQILSRLNHTKDVSPSDLDMSILEIISPTTEHPTATNSRCHSIGFWVIRAIGGFLAISQQAIATGLVVRGFCEVNIPLGVSLGFGGLAFSTKIYLNGKDVSTTIQQLVNRVTACFQKAPTREIEVRVCPVLSQTISGIGHTAAIFAFGPCIEMSKQAFKGLISVPLQNGLGALGAISYGLFALNGTRRFSLNVTRLAIRKCGSDGEKKALRKTEQLEFFGKVLTKASDQSLARLIHRLPEASIQSFHPEPRKLKQTALTLLPQVALEELPA